MAIRKIKPTTPGQRGMTVSAYDEITCTTPERSLLEDLKSSGGRNNHARITVRHRGGGCIEIKPGKGAQLVRSAGNAAQLMAKEGKYAQVRLPSGEVRLVPMNAKATIGQVGNIDHANIMLGKAGRTRHMGFRPTVRGSVMNPCDHPHGGGEGKSPVGRPGPVTPWGKPALGYKTRKTKNVNDKFIVRRRNGK